NPPPSPTPTDPDGSRRIPTDPAVCFFPEFRQEEDFQRPGSREEAQQLLELERLRVEQAMERQQKEMLEDHRWLRQEVQSLDPKVFLNNNIPPLLPEKETDYTQFTGPPQKPPRLGAQVRPGMDPNPPFPPPESTGWEFSGHSQLQRGQMESGSWMGSGF
ncbi:protein-tyrosine kinase 2-beta-like, partial [Passer montanus]|uniref:protein-tyrosine kinase 2-beta-like n=1 Tax=Passer montanus TaxID=9160 RepID=UPI001960F364